MSFGHDRSRFKKIRDMKFPEIFIFVMLTTSALVALGQSLPRLNINSSSNHQVLVAWPYTNSGFSFQEAKALSPATNWQASEFAPVFDSNRVQFSVSAPATNAANFF